MEVAPATRAYIDNRFIPELYSAQKKDRQTYYIYKISKVVSIILGAIASITVPVDNKDSSEHSFLWVVNTALIILTTIFGGVLSVDLYTNFLINMAVNVKLQREGWNYFNLIAEYKNISSHDAAREVFAERLESILNAALMATPDMVSNPASSIINASAETEDESTV